MSTTKNNGKKIEKDLDNFWRRKLTLNSEIGNFLIPWFRADVDLTKNFHEKVLFFTQFDSEVDEKFLNVIY